MELRPIFSEASPVPAGVSLTRQLFAPARNQLRDEIPKGLRRAYDGFVVEQIEQERAHSSLCVRATEIEENDRDTPRSHDAQSRPLFLLGRILRDSAHAPPFTIRTSFSTFSGVACGVMP